MAERFATIDVGTNTVLLLVAERGEGGALRAVDERMELTRLGRGVDRERRLSLEAIEETLRAVETFAAAAREAGAARLVITATSAARDAANGAEFFERVGRATGVSVEVLSGEAEAQAAYESARRDFGASGEPLVVVDIGGGSTELTFGEGGEVSFQRSFDVGAVRLTERWLRTDPPSPAELASLRDDLAKTLRGAPRRPDGARLVGIAGTVTTLCAVSLGLESYDGSRVHGRRLRATEVRDLAQRLAAMPLAERRRLPGLPPKRADVIVAGAEVVLAVMSSLGFEELVVSDRGVRWGILHQRFGGDP
ncbi:MAG TPA: Ppx/GppA phosphatase family protein [Vulgatibacter sp.]|nr:Ppx/GppA phosphatase family protein [Vulgatibacter sp.]